MTTKHTLSRALTAAALLAAFAMSLIGPSVAPADAAAKTCTYKGRKYSPGATVSTPTHWRICDDDGSWIIVTDD